MNAVERYSAELENEADWPAYLRARSGLPGPRANLELAEAAARTGTAERFEQLLSADSGPNLANTPDEFLLVCGIIGLGRLAADGQRPVDARLRLYANDTRWRMRESVAIALQKLGRSDRQAFYELLSGWVEGTLYEKRAVIAALCEPDLLRDTGSRRWAAAALADITSALVMCESEQGRTPAFLALKKALGYGWSVLVAAGPQEGKPLFEAMLPQACTSPALRWILRENLTKARLARMDPAWVLRCRETLAAIAIGT